MKIYISTPCIHCKALTDENFVCEPCLDGEHAEVLVAEAGEDR